MELVEVKKSLNKPVSFREKKYTLRACVIRKNDNGYYYQAEIVDKSGNSSIICGLDEIEKVVSDD